MKRQYVILIFTILSLSVILVSCSDVKRSLPTETSILTKNYSPYHCNSCHGNTLNAAPPQDLEGNTSISSPGVGAHQEHLLADDSISIAVACNECHRVPEFYNSPGHLDSTPGAEVLFQGNISKSVFAHNSGADTTAKYSPSTLTCINTYCHGNFLGGNKATATWTDTSGQSRQCGSCHGDVTKASIGERALPKTRLNGGIHMSSQDNANITQCYRCHPNVINSNYKLNPLKHINGQVDF
jgi:predicted CxxxxCH...CXXCH cytochrome family protein